MNNGLATVTPTGQARIAVDNTSIAWGAGRLSVRIESKATYNGGLFIMDAEHMPCVIVLSLAISIYLHPLSQLRVV